jgi:xylulokinase
MLLLGIDLGTSSVKVSVVDAQTTNCIASAQYPETESGITSLKPGWAEQSPETWWQHVQEAILKLHASKRYDPRDIGAIGIAYQMHGLVILDKQSHVLRDSIIWCDSRAVDLGNLAFEKIGREKCLGRLLNSPGNFTASKLAWVKEHEPGIYAKVDKAMLPGDYIALRMTGNVTTSVAALSEGVFWDFASDGLSEDVFGYYGLQTSVIPGIRDVFADHGAISDAVAERLGLKKNVPVTYKAGDQPNNALSLNVLNPGEVAATAGTSGVIYAVSDQLVFDKESRVNSFAHVNYTHQQKRIGVLLNINGTGILNRWMKTISGDQLGYAAMNKLASSVEAGCDGLQMLPFGNGAERMLNNRTVDAHIHHINFNLHHNGHLYRAAQEGIAFAFRYGLDIMRENGINPTIIRAGKANMFLSDVFLESFVNTTGVAVELYNCDGSVGAAIGAGIGAGTYKNPREAFQNFKPLEKKEPRNTQLYDELYASWKKTLLKEITG